MVLKSDQQRVKDLLTETITLLCKNGLEYNRVFSIDALIGITLDEDDVFLVSIRDTITNETSRHDSESSFVRSRKSVPMKRVSSSPMQNKKKRLRPSSPDVSNLPLKLYKAADIQNQVDQYENKQNSDNNLALSNDYVTLADDENGEHSEHTEENSQSNDVSSNKSPVQAASADIDSGQNMIGKIKQEVEDPEELRILKTETNDQLFADSFGDQAGCSWQSPTGVSNLSVGRDRRRVFGPDFKMAAVEYALQERNNYKSSRRFMVSESAIRKWIKEYKMSLGLQPVPEGHKFKDWTCVAQLDPGIDIEELIAKSFMPVPNHANVTPLVEITRPEGLLADFGDNTLVRITQPEELAEDGGDNSPEVSGVEDPGGEISPEGVEEPGIFASDASPEQVDTGGTPKS